LIENVLFRVDGSRTIGIGHLMRCVAFAQGFERIGVRSVFIVRDHKLTITELIGHHGFDSEILPRDCKFSDDASLTSEYANTYCANVIVTDISNRGSLKSQDDYRKYLEFLKGENELLVSIDGLDEDCISSKTSLPSDIIIIPYYGAENRKHTLYGCNRYLLGPTYFMLRQEFIEASRVSKDIRKDGRNILVTMGGSDPLSVTIKVAKAVIGLKRPTLNLRIVVGGAVDQSVRQKVQAILALSNVDYELIVKTDHMAELMLWADLVITGSGLTKYEAAATGTPSLVISQDRYHEEMMREFEGGGSALHLGCGRNVEETDIAEATEKLLHNSILRREMARNGKDLVDGKGVERVISEI
jgi:spore coat polysaccharide biosynthesis predicted glycosyltransferase SpsG